MAGKGRADEFHAVFFQDSVLGHGHGCVQACLTTQGWQQGARPFSFDDAGHSLWFDGLDVGPVGQVRIGHDRSRIGVDQDHLIPLFLQGFQGLGAGIVELTGLPDDNGTRTDEHYLLEICSLGHLWVDGLYFGMVIKANPESATLDG